MDSYFGDVYKDRVVLVTGHTGFKGGWLALWLKKLGAKVIGYSLEPPTEPSLFEEIQLEKEITHYRDDVRNEENLMGIFAKHQPEFVFHLAAQSLVKLSYKEPKLTYETNIIGMINVLEAVRKMKSVKVCIIVTSDKCYENKEWIYGYRETDALGGYDPYSSSKACAEIVTSAYRRSYFNADEFGTLHHISLSSVRAGNVIGGGDWAEDRIIPDCVKSLTKGEKIAIRNPSATRPWQYMLEPLAGYLLLGYLMYKDGAKYSGAWNFGPGYENVITVEELVKLVIKHWGHGEYMIDTEKRPHETRFLKLDTSKAFIKLGWRPVYDIFETIENTIRWYKNFNNNIGTEELYEFSLHDIKQFEDLVRNSY